MFTLKSSNFAANANVKLRVVIAAFLSLPLLTVQFSQAQPVPQTVDVAKVNVQKLTAGFRASKLIGTSVLDDANESIGKVDDLLVGTGMPTFAILSVGGFLGMDSRYVAVPYDALTFADNKVILRGSTKDSIRMLPEFKYTDK
jgi:PRC-barrel domain